MLKICRSFICVALTILLMVFSRLSMAESFLPPDQAFVFSAAMRDGQHVRVSFNIAPNYYMYRDDFSVVVVSPDGAVVQNGGFKLPTALMKFDENFNKNMAIYHGRVSFDLPVKGNGLFKLVVSSRGCADGGLCYPPRKTQEVLTARAENSSVPVEVKPGLGAKQRGEKASPPQHESASTTQPQMSAVATPSSPEGADGFVASEPVAQVVSVSAIPSLSKGVEGEVTDVPDNSAYARQLFDAHNVPVALLFMFGLGVLLSLTPCMLPMVPILSSILAGQRLVSKGRGLALAFAYVTGMALVYALVGLVAAKTGASLHRYLQSPWVLAGLSAMLLLLALSLFDVFQLQLPAKWQVWLNNKTQGKNGYWGVAVMGAVSALIASPCVTAPLVGVITYIAQTGNVLLGGLALFVLAYGMGVPLLLLGAGLGRLLPKSGAWMMRIKQAIGLIMVAAALWIAQPLWGKYWQNAWADPVPVVMFQSIKSDVDLNKVIASSDKPVFLDFYADWCRSCIEMEKKTFVDARIRERMSRMTLVRVDMTAYTDDDAALLARFKLYGPPAMIVLEPITGKEKIRVVGFETADVFMRSLDAAAPKP